LQYHRGGDLAINIQGTGKTVGRLTQSGGKPLDEINANAHLIAAAPELLDALEAVETELLSDRFNLSGQTQDQIRAAIRKAKGGEE